MELKLFCWKLEHMLCSLVRHEQGSDVATNVAVNSSALGIRNLLTFQFPIFDQKSLFWTPRLFYDEQLDTN